MGRRRSAFPPGPEELTPCKAEYINADHIVISFSACNKAADHTFSSEGHPSWTPLKLADVVAKLGCNPADLEQKTVEDTRLFQEIERLRHAINPFIDLPFPEWPEVIKRKLEIQTGQISKSQLQDLIQAGAKEQDIQRLIKRDLSIIAEFYAHPEDEYICFSEFPVDDGSVDFAIFSGRSRMDVTLIEVKGADYYLLNQDSYENFSQKFNESANQIR